MADETVRWRSFRIAKRGNTTDEYEDASAGDAARGRFAVADGVTESSFAGDWAKLLVEHYVEQPVKHDAWQAWLSGPRQQWKHRIGSQALPWYAEEKRESGAFATFLGLELKTLTLAGSPPTSRRRWSAVAVGDSCVFHVRGGRLLTSFPITNAEAFGNDPAVLGSVDPTGPHRDPIATWTGGDWHEGDTLALATDALAQWLLRRAQLKKPLGPALDRWLDQSSSEDDFASWITELRQSGQLRNDDVTLLMVAFDGPAPTS
jgi:serine/threonine protein phosphatase PrpC